MISRIEKNGFVCYNKANVISDRKDAFADLQKQE